MKDPRALLVISFVLKMKGDERIEGDGLWSCLSFVGVEVYRQFGSSRKRKMDECRERWNGQGGFIILYMFCSVNLGGDHERTEFLIIPAP